MSDMLDVIVLRAVEHDLTRYEPGDRVSMHRDMARTLIACGAAATPTPALPHEGGGGENEAAPEEEGPAQETPKAKAKKAAP